MILLLKDRVLAHMHVQI